MEIQLNAIAKLAGTADDRNGAFLPFMAQTASGNESPILLNNSVWLWPLGSREVAPASGLCGGEQAAPPSCSQSR
jgi:hypothetical protein